MDPMDEFEFKPLTEGLGFHKKAEKIKQDIKSTNLAREATTRSVPDVPPLSVLSPKEVEPDLSSRPASQSISDLIASLPPSLDFIEEEKSEPIKKAAEPTFAKPTFGLSDSTDVSGSASSGVSGSVSGRPQIFQPLVRDEYKPANSNFGRTTSSGGLFPPPAQAAAASVGAPTLGSSPYREQLEQSFARAFPHAEKTKREQPTVEPVEEGLKPVSASPIAALLDGMVVAGISMILLVSILAITRINLLGLLTNAQTSASTQIQLALLFLIVLQLYMLISRSLFGASLGEWAFDQQLGSNESQAKSLYPLQVAWRTLLVTATGFILIPLLSMIFRRDLAKPLTGLQLYHRD